MPTLLNISVYEVIREIILWGLPVSIIGLRLWSKRKRMRALKTVEPLGIASANEGEWVRVTGTAVRHHDQLTAPASLRSCLAYKLRVSADSNDFSLMGGAATPNIHESDVVAFRVRNETGEALVEAVIPEFHLVEDHEGSTGSLKEIPEPLKRFFVDHRVDYTKNFPFFEGVLLEGQRVSVWGKASWETNTDMEGVTETAYRSQPRCLVIRGDNAKGVVISNRGSLTTSGG